MSEQIKHECGIAFIRLLKPLSYYQEKYGTAFYGLNKMQLLMQKQRNRGQDGAGLATIKLNIEPGKRYISRKRSNSSNYLSEIFSGIAQHFEGLPQDKMNDPEWLKANKPYMGEVLLGHLRYGTHGINTIEAVHPFIRQNNWINRTLVMAGNFNLTNVKYLFEKLIELGQYPKEMSDTITILEKIGHFLDDEVQRLFNWFKPEMLTNKEINEKIFEHLNVQRILQRASREFDGGFVLAGMIGFGDAFIFRDPHGIRPAFYYQNDEIVVAASERPAIQTAFDISFNEIQEIKPGHALIIKNDGRITHESCLDAQERKSCSFERIYFARGNDRNIYLERKKLGKHLATPVLKAVDYDFDNTVFSYIPNTAETAFGGMIDELESQLSRIKKAEILKLGNDLDSAKLDEILDHRPRVEKIVVKDAKMRTFIADDESRGDLVSHIYDVTYGIVRNFVDTLVLLDDSIVRGTTLRDSIIRIVSRLKPKKIIVVSSAPQIRYPDCYGIDMSKMHEFAAFQAMISLLEERGLEHLREESYERCLASEDVPISEVKNEVKALYDTFTAEEISDRISILLTPPDINIEVQIIYQGIEALHDACPRHKGDWYFTGKFPTPGGNRVTNRSFVNYMEKKNVRAY